MTLPSFLARFKTFAAAQNKKSILFSKLYLFVRSYHDAGTRIQNIPGWFDRDDVLAYRSLVKRLPPGATVIEVGTWMGRSLANVATIRGDVTFVGVDAFMKTKDDLVGVRREKAGKERLNRFYFRFLRNMIWRNVGNVSILRMDSVKAGKLIRDDTVDLIFLDAGHTFEEVRDDILAWEGKVKAGGILAGHDYHPANSVAKAVSVCLGGLEVETFAGSSVWAVVLEPSTARDGRPRPFVAPTP